MAHVFFFALKGSDEYKQERNAFRKQRELNLMLGLKSNVEIGGRSGFIFNTKHGRPVMPAGVNSFLKNIVNAYNKKESKLAEEEKREPELMPPISSHTLRHTGCTRLGENNVNQMCIRDRKNPITQAIAAILANGCVKDRKPITVSRIPSTVNQPQPLTPSF